ncbi:homeobox protein LUMINIDEPENDENS-like [Salvia splendens]|uniref:homeobox protein LUMINIDEPENDENS-like n=1 Tax=Salvia splendens TaxID=180675 RepID=UPI001C27B601|nr:homeobox protein LUMINIDEPENDENS-like [Salvia splendens]
MESSKDTQLMEVAASPAPTSYQALLDEQKDLFQNQIEKLQQIVATQCKLTGVNPLSQEMAASALSIKIGKRPRDLLNPKAVNYMQLVFSLKDAISKRETREISSQFGVTVTQVRDFFAGQRTRVRKFVRLSREKANTSAYGLMHDVIATTSNLVIPAEPIPLATVGVPVPLDTVGEPVPLATVTEPIPLATVGEPVPLDTVGEPVPLATVTEPIPLATVAEPIPLATVVPTRIDEGSSSSKRHEDLPGLVDSEKHFIDNIFGLMRKEESFSGQVKLIRWILRITNPSVLNWFLAEGGLMILATWLSEAATEEQTSVLLVILKLFDFLPISKALPGHMSAILQSVNKLRFYRAADISNRARSMLSKWSKRLGKNLSSKKNDGLKSASDLLDEMLLKQSISEVMGNESWDLKRENPEDVLRFMCENPDSHRKLDTAQPLKMLTASGDDSNKRRGVYPPQTRERRKVQLVEHPGQRVAVRSPQVARSMGVTQSRPLSADDIQKAKMRAHFMQNKYGKTITPDEKIKSESEKRKSESENKLTTASPNASVVTLVSKANVQIELEEQTNVDDSLSLLSNPCETSLKLEEPPRKKYKRIQISWKMPPELKIDETWSVGEGANSKEVEVQNSRNRREREVFYRIIQEIPSNPREPWDREMDCDDSLTPEIPIEQLPDVEPLESPANPPHNSCKIIAPASSESINEPDFELLAALLKNPELVFALTSGQAGNLSSEETVKLLDRIKANGVNSLGNLANNTVEVSLPSPTPSSDPVPNGAKPDFSRNPFSRQQQQGLANGIAYGVSQARQQGMVSAIPAATILTPQRSASLQQYSHKVAPQLASVQLPEQWQPHTNPQMHHLNSHNSSNAQHFTSEMAIPNRGPSPAIWGEASGLSRSATPPNTLRARQGFESNYQYQSNPSANYHHGYSGGHPSSSSGTWGGRSRREYESWSPDHSPSRRHEYVPGQRHNEPSLSLRNGYRHGKTTQQDFVQHSGYQDAGSKRGQDRRR